MCAAAAEATVSIDDDGDDDDDNDDDDDDDDDGIENTFLTRLSKNESIFFSDKDGKKISCILVLISRNSFSA